MEVYEGNSLWRVRGLEGPLHVDSQCPMAPQPLQPQTRKQTGLGDPAALTLLGPRSGLAKLLKLPPHGGVFPRKPGHCKVQETLPWEARPTAVGSQNRGSASPE